MDPYKDKVLRISYYSKITKKPKHKQVKVKDFESEEKAKLFLDKWKQEKIAEETKLLMNEVTTEPSANQPEDPPSEPYIPKNIEPPTPIPQPMSIEYSKFELSVPDFKKKDGNGKSTVMVASSRGGKTTLMNHIIKKWFDNKDVITTLMCPSLNADIYKAVRKNKNILKSDGYIPGMIKDVAKIERKTDNKYNFAFFLDDIIDAKGSEELLKMFLTYRNLNISSCINIQDTKLLSRPLRHNANNFIFMRLNTHDAIMDVIDLFLNSYEPFSTTTDKNAKINMYRELTKNYGFIYLNALEDKITFHKPV